VMRVIALSAGGAGAFSIGGSAEVVLFGIALGAPVALVFFALRQRIPLPAPWGGIAVGLMLFAMLALIPPPAAQSALAGTPDPPALTASLFGALFAAYGGVLDWWWRRLRAARD
ncbi:MAG: hypothetical protein ACREON_18310, partial [Gemmatimonadaceae bacterium]